MRRAEQKLLNDVRGMWAGQAGSMMPPGARLAGLDLGPDGNPRSVLIDRHPERAAMEPSVGPQDPAFALFMQLGDDLRRHHRVGNSVTGQEILDAGEKAFYEGHVSGNAYGQLIAQHLLDPSSDEDA